MLAANTAASDFAPLDLVSGERPMSLYLTLAPADLDRLRGPIRRGRRVPYFADEEMAAWVAGGGAG